MSWCCGPRDGNSKAIQENGLGLDTPQSKPDLAATKAAEDDAKKQRDAESEANMKHMQAHAKPPPQHAYATLVIKVECAEGLLGVDPNFNFEKMVMESTQDPFVSFKINDDEVCAKTTVRWKSQGSAVWDETFSTGVVHPRSFLCVTVMDDDPLFGQDNRLIAAASNAAGQESGLTTKSLGFLEIPLSEMPRNQLVTGWFKLNHPDLADKNMNMADREQKLVDMRKHKTEAAETPREEDCPHEDGEDPLDAGRVKLQLLLQTTVTKEFLAGMKPAPVFKQSLPPLDLPHFLEDVKEVKRIIVERLVVAPIKMFLYAISWEDPRLSFGMLCWHIFVCYHTQLVPASLWIVLLLCFWHKIPEDKPQEKSEDASRPKNVVEGVAKGGGEFVHEIGHGIQSAVLRPLEGAQKDGIRGLAKGVQQGLQSNVKHTVNAFTGLASNVKGGVDATVGQLGVHGIGLQEMQNILLVQPRLADVLRGLQPSAKSAHASLRQVDDYFYWANKKMTEKIVGALVVILLISIVFKGYMRALSGYVWLVVGSVVILAKAKLFNMMIAAIKSGVAVCFKPKVPYAKQEWFEAVGS